MVLSVFMVQTLTTLLEPPPAIGGAGGAGKGLLQPGQTHPHPQANIAVFMFLFMLCAAEVVFIKLLALTSFASEPPSSPVATGVAASSPAASSSYPFPSSSSSTPAPSSTPEDDGTDARHGIDNRGV